MNNFITNCYSIGGDREERKTSNVNEDTKSDAEDVDEEGEEILQFLGEDLIAEDGGMNTKPWCWLITAMCMSVKTLIRYLIFKI